MNKVLLCLDETLNAIERGESYYYIQNIVAPMLRNILLENVNANRQAPRDRGGLYRVVYRSHSLLSEVGLEDLLNQARCNNLVIGVTGAIIYWNDQFVQFLEGPEETVIGLMQTIRSDPRHRGFTLLESRPIPEKKFGKFLMASIEVDAEEFGALQQNLSSSTDRLDRKISSWMESGRVRGK